MDTAQTAPLIKQTPQPQLKAPAGQVKETARQFEAFFIHQMLEHMSEGIESPEVYGGGSAENIFRSMLNEKIADEVSHNSNLGIAETIEKQIQRYQDNANRR